MRGAGARARAASARRLYRDRAATHKAVAKLVADAIAAFPRAGHERRAARRDFAKGAGHTARSRQLRKRISRGASRGRADRRIRRYVETLMHRLGLIGDWGLGIARLRAVRVTLLVLAARRTRCTHRTHCTCLRVSPCRPSSTRPVNDFANVIDPASEAELERRILELKKRVWRRRGGRDDRHVRAATPTSGVRGEDVRESRPRHRRQRAKTTGCSCCWR